MWTRTNIVVVGIAKRPDFIQIESLSRRIAESLILEFQATFVQFDRKFLNCALGYARNANGRPDGNAVAQALYDRDAFFAGELFQGVITLGR